jgi:hypothetical protein
MMDPIDPMDILLERQFFASFPRNAVRCELRAVTILGQRLRPVVLLEDIQESISSEVEELDDELATLRKDLPWDMSDLGYIGEM